MLVLPPCAPRPPARILIADDQPDVLEALRLLLKGEGFDSETVSSPSALLAALDAGDFDAVLMDLNYARDTTSGQEGLDLLARIQEIDANLPVVVMTAWGTVDVAVEAMRRGARDFVQKPWENARLLATLRTQVALGRALRKGQRLEAENRILRHESADGSVIAESAAMRPVLELVARVAPSDANVLITGENGTGKGVVARALHAASRRSSRPLVSLNAGGISEGVFESELFGHVKGAFTDARADRVGRFELADGGTLFLDEIANVPGEPAGEAAAGPRDGRVRAARLLAHAARRRADPDGDQREPARGGRRRPLPAGPALPPEHDRDPRAPAARAPRGHSRRSPSTSCSSTRSATARGRSRSRRPRCGRCSTIPGRATSASSTTRSSARPCSRRESTIRAADLGLRRDAEAPMPLDEMSLEDVEGVLIQKAMARYGGNVSHAARALGLSRSALYRRLEKHGH